MWLDVGGDLAPEAHTHLSCSQKVMFSDSFQTKSSSSSSSLLNSLLILFLQSIGGTQNQLTSYSNSDQDSFKYSLSNGLQSIHFEYSLYIVQNKCSGSRMEKATKSSMNCITSFWLIFQEKDVIISLIERQLVTRSDIVGIIVYKSRQAQVNYYVEI